MKVNTRADVPPWTNILRSSSKSSTTTPESDRPNQPTETTAKGEGQFQLKALLNVYHSLVPIDKYKRCEYIHG